MAGYPHFYFHNCREVAKRFVDMAEEASTKDAEAFLNMHKGRDKE